MTINNDTSSTLNEVDIQTGKILLGIMQLADKRTDDKGNPLWNDKRIVFSSSQDRETIFHSYMMKNNVPDITYPILAYTPSPTIRLVDNSLGARPDSYAYLYDTEKNTNSRSKIKKVITSYTVSVWDDDFKTIRMFQDKLILRCIDKCLFYEYKSQVMDNATTYLSTLINIPQINTVPNAQETTKGAGYIYALGFNFNVWATLSDDPQDEAIIRQINLNIHNKLETDDKAIRITIIEK